MAYEMKDNSGSLFRNDKKEADSHPNAKGSALIDGVEYWVSAWTKKDKNGNPWQSLAFKRKDDQVTRSAKADELRSAVRGKPMAQQIDDDVPF